jgi:hypothetical protein
MSQIKTGQRPPRAGVTEVSPVAPLIGTDDHVAAWDAPASSHAAPFWCPCPAFTTKTPDTPN